MNSQIKYRFSYPFKLSLAFSSFVLFSLPALAVIGADTRSSTRSDSLSAINSHSSYEHSSPASLDLKASATFGPYLGVNNQTAFSNNFKGQGSGYQNISTVRHDDTIELPDLGSGSGRFLETNQHKALGEWSIQQLSKRAPLLHDPWSQEQLERLVWRLNAQARAQAPLALIVINSPSINAFAIPGGVMGINTGTVIEADSIDEVASVMAHEVAHLSQRHYEHRGDANKKALMLQIGGLLAAIAASAADGDAATAIMMGSQTAAMNSQMAFSRSNEREADRIGMQIMAKTGYDPRAMPRFFATLDQKMQLNVSKQVYLPSFIMSHPLSSERLSEARSRANSYDTVHFNNQQNQTAFDLLKWRLKALSNKTNENELLAASRQSTGATLALAHWYGMHGRYNDANKVFASMSSTNQQPVAILSAITQAEVAGMRAKWSDAEQLMLPYYNLYPERRDVKLSMANIWLHLDQPNKVLTTLQPLVKARPHDTEALTLMQRAYEVMATKEHANAVVKLTGNNENSNRNQGLADVATINALRYRAKVELWHGEYEDALISIEQASRLAEKMDASNGINSRPLIAQINSDKQAIKTAKSFRP